MGRTVLGFFIKDERLLEMDEMLLAMALHDALTGVYKREFFLGELHREFERSRRHRRPLALILLDIDHFKLVNDELGHVAGDDALRQVANVIRVGLREGDLCGRYGGEEFAVLLPETDLDGARLAAERIRHDVENYTFKLTGGHKRHITLSAGVALLDQSMQDKVDLVDAADKLLYRAKQAGRNRVEA
jgi:diguanylate cyclase (GGDEF)-like protein